jgi:hypothetical protein
MRGIYGAIGGTIGEQSDVVERVTKYLGLKKKEEAAPAEESRF